MSWQCSSHLRARILNWPSSEQLTSTRTWLAPARSPKLLFSGFKAEYGRQHLVIPCVNRCSHRLAEPWLFSQLSPEEQKAIVNGFTKPDVVTAGGLRLQGQKFFALRADDKTIQLKKSVRRPPTFILRLCPKADDYPFHPFFFSCILFF